MKRAREWEDIELLLAHEAATYSVGEVEGPIPSEADLQRLTQEIAEGRAEPNEQIYALRTLASIAGIRPRAPGRPRGSKGATGFRRQAAGPVSWLSLQWAMLVLDAATAVAVLRGEVLQYDYPEPTLGVLALRRLQRRSPRARSHKEPDVLLEMLRQARPPKTSLHADALSLRAKHLWSDYGKLATKKRMERFAREATVPDDLRSHFKLTKRTR